MPRSRRWTNCFLALALTAGAFVATGLAQGNAAGAASTSPPPSQTTTAQATAQSPSQPAKSDDDRLPFMTERRETEAEAPSAGGLLVRTLGALLLIVGLIAAAAWGLRRFGGTRFGAPAEDAPELTVLTTISLGDKRSLAAVRFGERLLLIGSTAQSVTLLATDEPRPVWGAQARSVADLLEEDETPSFEQALIRADRRMRRVHALPDVETPDAETPDAEMDAE